MPVMTMAPTATTVAGDEPDTAANNMQARTDAIAKPPRKWPIHALAKRIMRRATPPVVMKEPPRIKKGIASSVYCSDVSNSLSVSDASESCAKIRIVSNDDRPRAMATGMPISINTKSKIKSRAIVIYAPHRKRLLPGASGPLRLHRPKQTHPVRSRAAQEPAETGKPAAKNPPAK